MRLPTSNTARPDIAARATLGHNLLGPWQLVIGVERLAEDRLRLVVRARRVKAERLHGGPGVWREKDLVGHPLVVGRCGELAALGVLPTSELGAGPHVPAAPRERVETDAIRVRQCLTIPVVVLAGEDGPDHR